MSAFQSGSQHSPSHDRVRGAHGKRRHPSGRSHPAKPPSKPSSATKKLKNVIGPQFNRLRCQRGWTQEQTAVKLQAEGMAKQQSDVAKIESCRVYVDSGQLVVFARLFNVGIEDLFAPSYTRKEILTVIAPAGKPLSEIDPDLPLNDIYFISPRPQSTLKQTQLPATPPARPPEPIKIPELDQIAVRVEPGPSTAPVEPKLAADQLVAILKKEGVLSSMAISRRLGYKSVCGSVKRILRRCLASAEIERTVPNTPHSPFQCYQLPSQSRAAADNTADSSSDIPDSAPESELWSSRARVESELLADRFLAVLKKCGPMSVLAIARQLGQKTVSGPLKKIMRQYLASGTIERTHKPHSPFQTYQLASEKHAIVAGAADSSSKVPDSAPEPELWSRRVRVKPEPLVDRFLAVLKKGGRMTRLAVARELGQKSVSGSLNKLFRRFLSSGEIACTDPAKPTNPSQSYWFIGKDQNGAGSQ